MELQAERFAAVDARRNGRAGKAQRGLQPGDRAGIAERHLRAGPRPASSSDQHDRAAPARRQRIDAQLVVVAEGRLQQAGIDALPGDVFEDLLGAGFFDRHGVAQLAVDVEGEAAHDLAGAERKLELAFEDAAVRVEEFHLHAGLGDTAGDLDVDLQRVQPDRLLLGAADEQRRRSPWWRPARRPAAARGAVRGPGRQRRRPAPG